MRRLPVALVPAAVGLLLAACVGDRDTTAPRSAPNAASFGKTPPATCDFNTLRSEGRDFFSSNTDPVFDIIKSMTDAFGTGGAAAATPFGLDVFAQIASARLTSRQIAGASAAGGTLVRDVAKCTNLGAVDPAVAATALASGIFEVRGGTGDSQSPALAKPDVFPRWGVEIKAPATTWPTPRHLVLGTPGAATTELGGEPQSISGFVGYEVATLPVSVPKGGLRVGICIKTTTADLNAVNRLIHGGVVEGNSAPTFCDGAPLATLSRSAWFASLANRVTSAFAPALLFAQDGGGRDLDSFTGGGPSSWSPMAWGKIVGASVALQFSTQPKNGFNTAPLAPFVVHAGTPGHALSGTLVTITVFGNSGLPAGAFVSGTLTIPTDGNGDATFNDIVVNKAGGYTLTATATYGGVPTGSTVSTLFNIKNK